MATTGLSVFITVFILQLHHKTFTKPVPVWIRRLLFMGPNSVAETTRHTDGLKQLATNTIQSNGTLEQCAKNSENVENESKNSGSQSHVDCDHEWKAVIRRIDHCFFLLFLLIFSMLVLIVAYPYKGSITLESGKCDV